MPLLFVSFSFRFKVIVKNENILVKSYMNDLIYFLVVAILFVWDIGKPGLCLGVTQTAVGKLFILTSFYLFVVQSTSRS